MLLILNRLFSFEFFESNFKTYSKVYDDQNYFDCNTVHTVNFRFKMTMSLDSTSILLWDCIPQRTIYLSIYLSIYVHHITLIAHETQQISHKSQANISIEIVSPTAQS